MKRIPNIICFDLETSSVDVKTTQILEIACVAIDPYKLKIIQGSEFVSKVKPDDESTVERGALEVNKLTLEDLRLAPSIDVVWPRFIEHVNKYNPNPKSTFLSPLACGKNIIAFDIPIIQRYCERFGNIDKGGKQNILSQRNMIELEQDLFRWFAASGELENQKMDTVRDYFGISKENAHSAMKDVLDTAYLTCKFLALYRQLFKKVRFKDSIKGNYNANDI